LYLAEAKNNVFNYNKADITGGAFYSPRRVVETSFNFKDNIVNGDDYTSKPAYIYLSLSKDASTESIVNSEITEANIVSGDTFPLYFVLLDEFYKPFEDKSKFYSSISLKVQLRDIDDNEEMFDDYENDIKYSLIGNSCSFTNGINFYILFFFIKKNLIQ